MTRPLRTVAYVALLLTAVVWLAVRHAPSSPAEPDDQGDVTVERMEATLASLRASIAARPDTVILLGDSSYLQHFALPPTKTLQYILESEGAAAGVPMRVVAYNGFDPIAYYLLADEIAALGPRAVVLSANLQAFTDGWFRNPRMKHRELAAYLRPRRLPWAMALPLDIADISDASLAIDPVLRRLGASGVPAILEGYRDRFHAVLDQLSSARSLSAFGVVADAVAAEPPGIPRARSKVGRGQRPVRSTTNALKRTDLYPSRLDRSWPSMRMLEAAVGDLTANGVRTVVLIAPLHLQALQLTGAYAQREIPQAVALIAAVSAEQGGTPLDLSHALPQESYFTDVNTHFSAEGNRLVADAILAELRRLLDN